MQSNSVPAPRSGLIIASLLFLAGLALSAAGAYFQHRQIDRNARAEFQRLSERTETEVAARLDSVVRALRSARGLYAASNYAVSREAFRNFVLSRKMDVEFPGVRGFGFIQRVELADLPAFVAAERADGAPGFAIRQLQDKDKQDLFVIKFLEPAANNKGAQGLDLGSESLRRAGLQQAINTGAPTVTGAITLVQDDKKQPGFLLFLPVYRNGMPIDVPQERRAALVGVVYAPIVMAEILQGMPDVQSGMLDFQVVDSPINSSGGTLMFDADGQVNEPSPGVNLEKGKHFVLRKPLQLPGRSVTLGMQSTPAFDATFNWSFPWLLLAGGAAISALLALMMRQQAGARLRAENLAKLMTADLHVALSDNQALYRVTSAIIDRIALQDLLQIVADSVADALPAERIAVITFDLAEQKVVHFAKGGTGAESIHSVPFEELMHGLSGWVIREGLPALSLSSEPDPRESPEVQKRRADTRCGDIIVVPMRYQGNTLGTMTAINQTEGAAFGQRQVDLMTTIAMHTAVAITLAQDQARLQAEIEERKLLESSLALARDQALEASRLKSSFLANMSHEIRTPMNAILGMLNLLQSTELTPRQLDYASKTEDAAKSLLGLLNDILDFSKVEAGKMTLESEPFRMDKLLRNLSVVLSANVGNKDIEVLFDLDASLPAVVKGDAMRLQQVLINLGGNAVKFTSVGQVVLAMRNLGLSGDAVRIEFSVKDSGIGIAAEHQAHIFSGFSQAEASTTRRFGGTGLGLAISQRFVELMGGNIQIRSTLGEGSTFAFVLEMPVVQVLPPELAEPARAPLPAQRVLVVDDNPIAAELTLRMARSWGWVADLARSGAEAQERVAGQLAASPAEFPYTVVYMDWQLGDTDGWEVTRQLREFARNARLAQPTVIMLTAHGRDMLAQRTPEEQELLNGFLVKPVTASMLYDAVMEASAGNIGLRIAGRSASNARQLSGMRILVVEDNLINQQVADELLSAAGALVSLAANGQLGADAVAAAAPQFDVVLMDLQMPVLDGYGATRIIREELGLTQLPIIAMTANAMASDREACLAAGMNEHIGKPFDMAKLVSLLIRMTGYQSQQGQGEGGAPGEPASAGQALPVLPVVAGLDIQTAVARMSGMRSLYLRTARDFVRIMDTVAAELRQYLDSGDRSMVTMRLHTLKGNAATLGATELAAQSAKLESLSKTDAGMRACTEELETFETLVRSTQRSLQKAIDAMGATPALPGANAAVRATAHADTAANADSAASAADPAALAAAHESLQTIAALAQASDLAALECFANNRDVLSVLPGDFVDQLDEALQGLDLQAAQQLCASQLA